MFTLINIFYAATKEINHYWVKIIDLLDVMFQNWESMKSSILIQTYSNRYEYIDLPDFEYFDFTM